MTQTDNNEYYLRHLYDGTYNKAGCLFADYENQADFSDRNTIIYGHNMRDGSMFAVLNQYDGQPYFDTHRQMYLVTPEGGYVVELFSGYVADTAESAGCWISPMSRRTWPGWRRWGEVRLFQQGVTQGRGPGGDALHLQL